MFGRGQRSELDGDEAIVLTRDLKAELAREIQRIQNKEKL